MNISVIVPTYNGAHKLPVVLESLINQTVQEFELIVVVDGSTDDTPAILKVWLPRFANAKSLFQENGGRSRARNAGVRASQNGLLIFVDDDMRLEPGCILQHVRHHQHIPGSLVSGAQIYDERKALNDFQRYKSFISRNWCREIESIYPSPLPKEKLHLTAANFSVSKNLFEQLGKFDETVNDMEDFLLAYRAQQQNIPVYYLHTAFGWHDDFADIYAQQERYLQYNQAAKIVAVRYPELQQQYPRYAVLPPTFFQKIRSRILSDKQFVGFINNNLWLPRSIRYKLYGAIMQAKAE